MRLINDTPHRTKEVLAIVRDALGDLRDMRGLTVRVLQVRGGGKVTSDSTASSPRGPYRMTIKTEPAAFFPADFSGEGYRDVRLESWRERIYFVAAHEANHIRLHMAGKDDQDTEAAADRAAIWKLRRARLRALLGFVSW